METANTSGFIRTGRARKVHRLCRGIDAVLAGLLPGATEAAKYAYLAAAPLADRVRIAMLCGARKPSDDTWTAFLAAFPSRNEVPVAELRDAPIPVHVCELNEDDTHHCRRCGAVVESVIR